MTDIQMSCLALAGYKAILKWKEGKKEDEKPIDFDIGGNSDLRDGVLGVHEEG
jgi:hypothetical protein